MRLNKKVFIITGASSGIGEALSKSLAQRGAIIVCAARRENELRRVTDEIINKSGTALSVKTDITNVADCRFLIKKTIEEYGRID